MIGHIILRLVIWFLLTANFSLANIVIGISIALLLPRGSTSLERFQDLLKGLGRIMLSIPQAYQEAIELMLRPHLQEEIVMERVSKQRSPGLIFLDIFLITFTPKTTVLKYDPAGWYKVHHLRRRQPR
ncbi:MAG: Na+/H+ antiporter subunit E [Aphanocapsa sp. GSE-SYN-MK-11-07L]|jgi:multicomponent Na+:H+ antiporter subunit E|nr:Na+/H+ antiporter subunit E [Aphanocapsa sp. GSE-SYN-MK-11-07L]